MIYFSELVVSSMTASVTVKSCLESEANTKIKWKKQSRIMSIVSLNDRGLNASSTCVEMVTQVICPGGHACNNTCYLKNKIIPRMITVAFDCAKNF